MSILKYTISLSKTFFSNYEQTSFYMLGEAPLTLGMILYYKVIMEDLKKDYDSLILCEKIRKALTTDFQQLVITESETELLKQLILKTEGIVEDLKGQILQYINEEMKED